MFRDFLGFVFSNVVVWAHVMGGVAGKRNRLRTTFPKDMVVSGQPPKALKIASFHQSGTWHHLPELMLYRDTRQLLNCSSECVFAEE